VAGLPPRLRSGVEALSGIAMDDVRVHRNSSEPAKLGALAFTKGAEIHLGPGQEEHLPHEAWHVVQQKQGRVQATTQMKGAAISDDSRLEREADRMGAMARDARATTSPIGQAFSPVSSTVVQRQPDKEAKTIGSEIEPMEVKEWRKKLQGQGYEVYSRKQFDRVDWLAKAFPDGRARPDMIAINRTKRHILVGDITAGPESPADLKPGDVQKLPHGIGAEPEKKHHLEKTVEDARKTQRNLPDDMKDYSVSAQDRWWRKGGYSVEVKISKPVAIPKPSGGTPPTGSDETRSKASPKPIATPPKPEAADPTKTAKRAPPAPSPQPKPSKSAASTEDIPSRKAPSSKTTPQVKKPESESKPSRRATSPVKAPSDPDMVPSTGSHGTAVSKTANAASHAVGNVLNNASSKLMAIATEKGIDPDLAKALNTFNKAMEIKGIITDPKAAATKLGSIAIDAVLDHYRNQLRAQINDFEIRFPDPESLQRRFSTSEMRSAYAVAVLRLNQQAKLKALLVAFLALGSRSQEEFDRAVKEILPKLVAQSPTAKPDFDHYESVRVKYSLSLVGLSLVTDSLIYEVNNLPAGIAGEITKRADLLDRLSLIFSDLSDQLVPFSAFPVVDASILYFRDVAEGLQSLAGQMRSFGYEVAGRKTMYQNERARLDAEIARLKEHSAFPFSPFKP
jgi:hypothetical protein